MSKPTVASVKAELDELKLNAGNVQLSQMTVWNWEQVASALEEYDRYGEMVEMKITRDFYASTTKRCYHLAIWHRPLLNLEIRAEQRRKGNVYQNLRDTKEHI